MLKSFARHYTPCDTKYLVWHFGSETINHLIYNKHLIIHITISVWIIFVSQLQCTKSFLSTKAQSQKNSMTCSSNSLTRNWPSLHTTPKTWSRAADTLDLGSAMKRHAIIWRVVTLSRSSAQLQVTWLNVSFRQIFS